MPTKKLTTANDFTDMLQLILELLKTKILLSLTIKPDGRKIATKPSLRDELRR